MINEIDEKNKENFVRSLGVFELRGLARELGVSSPTTKKREELIALILDRSKEGSCADKKSKRGRPYKKLNSLADIVNSMISEAKPIKNEAFDFQTAVYFQQDPIPALSMVGNECFEFEGVVRIFEDRFVFFDKNDNSKVVFEDGITGLDKIKEGDIVKVNALQANEDSFFIAVQILEINGQNVEEYQPEEFEEGEEIISNNEIPFAGKMVKEGRRNVYSYNEDLFENTNFADLTEYCKENDADLLVMSFNSSYENMIMFRNLDVDMRFVTEYGNIKQNYIIKTAELISRAKNLVARGKKVIVFLHDVIEMIRTIDKSYEKEGDELYSSQAVVIMQSLISIGRAYKNSSITLIISYNEMDKDDKFLNQEIIRISKKIN